MHPKLGARGPWCDHAGALANIEGTLQSVGPSNVCPATGPRNQCGQGCRSPPLLLLTRLIMGGPKASNTQYCRRFGIERGFRILKQHLGWTHVQLRDPAAADRWTVLTIIAHTQLRPTRPLASDCHLPWQRPLPTEKLTPTWGACLSSPHPPDTDSSGVRVGSLQSGPGASSWATEHHPSTRSTSCERRMRGQMPGLADINFSCMNRCEWLMGFCGYAQRGTCLTPTASRWS